MCVLPGSFREMGTFYFKIENLNRRDILNTTILTRITAHKQSLTVEGINITFNYNIWNVANE